MFRWFVKLFPWFIVQRLASKQWNGSNMYLTHEMGMGNKDRALTVTTWRLDDNSFLCILKKSELEKQRDKLQRALDKVDTQIDKAMTEDEFKDTCEDNNDY